MGRGSGYQNLNSKEILFKGVFGAAEIDAASIKWPDAVRKALLGSSKELNEAIKSLTGPQLEHLKRILPEVLIENQVFKEYMKVREKEIGLSYQDFYPNSKERSFAYKFYFADCFQRYLNTFDSRRDPIEVHPFQFLLYDTTIDYKGTIHKEESEISNDNLSNAIEKLCYNPRILDELLTDPALLQLYMDESFVNEPRDFLTASSSVDLKVETVFNRNDIRSIFKSIINWIAFKDKKKSGFNLALKSVQNFSNSNTAFAEEYKNKFDYETFKFINELVDDPFLEYSFQEIISSEHFSLTEDLEEIYNYNLVNIHCECFHASLLDSLNCHVESRNSRIEAYDHPQNKEKVYKHLETFIGGLEKDYKTVFCGLTGEQIEPLINALIYSIYPKGNITQEKLQKDFKHAMNGWMASYRTRGKWW